MISLMTPKERLIHYSKVEGPKGTLATLFRFQNKPNSDYPQIYLPHDSLLNHTSRLVRETKLWLEDLLTRDELLETQHILVGHDVRELVDGDESRLSASGMERINRANQILLDDDVDRFESFVEGQNFLENGIEEFPRSPLSILARVLDTIDGNYFAFAMLENYAIKVGGRTPDHALQKLLDRSYAYVNKMRLKYRNKIAQTLNRYELDLVAIYEHLRRIEAEKLDRFSAVIERQGYRTTALGRNCSPKSKPRGYQRS